MQWKRFFQQLSRFNYSTMSKGASNKFLSYPPYCKVNIIGTGAPGKRIRSVVVNTGQTNYFINCGENVSRVMLEYRSIKTSNIKHLLITSFSWENVGGLLGMALSLNSSSVHTVTLHGPQNMKDIIMLQERLLDANSCKIEYSDILNTPFKDEAFVIEAIPIRKTNSQLQDTEEIGCDDTSIAYLFKPKECPPKLSIRKCVELGIPKNVLNSNKMSALKRGVPLVLDNGTVITFDQVLENVNSRGRPFLILECPSHDFLPSLVAHEGLLALSKAIGEDQLSLVVHLTPRDIVDTTEYQSFIQRFVGGSTVDNGVTVHTTQQILVDRSDESALTTGSYSLQAVLNHYLDARVFPLLFDQMEDTSTPPQNHQLSDVGEEKATSKLPDSLTTGEYLNDLGPVVVAKSNMIYSIRPSAHFEQLERIKLDNKVFIQQLIDDFFMITEEEVTKAMKELQEKVKVAETTLPCRTSRPYPMVYFLGTGSSKSSKYRNTTGILLQTSPTSYIILDCGEGTLLQMYLLFGVDRTRQILKHLKLIAITHMHLDHHGGIYSIIREHNELWKEDNGKGPVEAISILAPHNMAKVGGSYDAMFDTDYFQRSQMFNLSAYCTSSNELDINQTWYPEFLELQAKLGLQIRPISVPHTTHSWGFSLTSRGTQEDTLPWHIVFSGDTKPCEDLARLGEGCDLLIHEATMEDDMEALAETKNHSTASQAISIGHQMKAKFILLTHFSQRYSKIQRVNHFYPDVGVAFDFMQVTLNDLPFLSLHMPYYRYLFYSDWVEQKKKFAKRKHKTADSPTNEGNKDIPPIKSSNSSL